MRIAHVITRMVMGGAQENTLSSVEGLSAIRDHRVTLLTGPETGFEGNLLDTAPPFLDAVYVPSMKRSINPLNDVRTVRWLTDWFRSAMPDIVHTHCSKAGVVGRVSARLAGVPHVVHTLHGLVFHDYQPQPVRTAYRQIKRAMVPFTDYYISVSDDIRERAIAAGIGRPDQHCTIRSGFPTASFVGALKPRNEAREQLGIPADRLVVGVVARLFALKGHDEVLAVAPRLVRKHPDLLFAFVGSGPLEAQLQQSVQAHGLADHVAFVGRVKPESVPLAFSALDVLVHTSLREGLARVIPQAVLARVPVVAYDLDGSREVIRDGKNGFLVRPRDTAQLADRLELLVANEGLRNRIGGVGADRIMHEYSAEEMVRRLDELYRHLGATSARRSQRRCA